jgi:hypothetical protein
MSRSVAMLLALGVLMIAFCYWGVETERGGHAFDEMDGMIPIGAGLLGASLVAATGVLAIVRRRRRLEQSGEAL